MIQRYATNLGTLSMVLSALLLGCSGTGEPSGNTNSNANGNANGNANANANANANVNTNDNGQNGSNDNGSQGNDNQNGGPGNERLPVLFVVNNNSSITSYGNADALNGEIPPDTKLNLGGATSIFQPRAVIVTSEGILLISRQNGGIVGFDSALEANGDDPADRVIEGNDTELDSPIAFAYDRVNDRLFVGNISAGAGILVFDQVSAIEFDGPVMPDRTFGPADRGPFGEGSEAMGVEAMSLDPDGNLYVADLSGLNTNRARIVVFPSAGTAEGRIDNTRIIMSQSWSNIEDIFLDLNDRLYVVDGSESVFMLFDVSAQSGEVIPSDTLTVGLQLVSLQGVEVASDGTLYLADTSNHAVYTFAAGDPFDDGLPDSTLDGFLTGLSAPRQMFLLEAQNTPASRGK